MQLEPFCRDLPAGFGPDRGVAAATPWETIVKASEAGFSDADARADLLAFIGCRSSADSARALGLSERTVRRLRDGYWPANDRALMRAWSAYRTRHLQFKTRWCLRLVRDGGAVRHGRRAYGSPHMTGRVGQLVAVARTTRGELVAQTLHEPVVQLKLVQLTPASAMSRSAS